MAVYKAPVKDIAFVLNEVLDVSSLAKLPGYEDATPDTIQAIVEEAGKLCENVLFPLNRTGDEEGCECDAHGQGPWSRRLVVRKPVRTSASSRVAVGDGMIVAWPSGSP